MLADLLGLALVGDGDLDDGVDRDVVDAAARVTKDELLLGDVLEVGAEDARATVEVDEQLAGERNRRRDAWGKGRGDALDVASQHAADLSGAEADGGVDALNGLDEVAAQGGAAAEHDGALGGADVA